jgi:hypothetical protein
VATAAALLVGGLALAIWLVGLIRMALFEPQDIPLLQLLISTSESIVINDSGEQVTITGADKVFAFIVVIVLLGALGGITKALIAGGISLLSRAYGLGGGGDEKKSSGD